MSKKILAGLIWPFRGVALISIMVLLFLTSAEIGGRIRVNADFKQAVNGIDIFVISNGIHTDIAVPYKTSQIDWEDQFPSQSFRPAVASIADRGYISFGWGDRGLYENVPTWDDLTLPIAARSLLWPTQSAMHVTYLPAPPKTGEWVKKVRISEDQYQILIGQVEQSFARDAQNRPISLNCCWYGHIYDGFYESPPKYHVLRTCNNWTNRVLKITGLPSALWTPNHEHILNHLSDIPELSSGSGSPANLHQEDSSNNDN